MLCFVATNTTWEHPDATKTTEWMSWAEAVDFLRLKLYVCLGDVLLFWLDSGTWFGSGKHRGSTLFGHHKHFAGFQWKKFGFRRKQTRLENVPSQRLPKKPNPLVAECIFILARLPASFMQRTLCNESTWLLVSSSFLPLRSIFSVICNPERKQRYLQR